MDYEIKNLVLLEYSICIPETLIVSAYLLENRTYKLYTTQTLYVMCFVCS